MICSNNQKKDIDNVGMNCDELKVGSTTGHFQETY